MMLGLLEAKGAGSNSYIYISTDIPRVQEIWNDQSENEKNVCNHHSGGSMILPARLVAFYLECLDPL